MAPDKKDGEHLAETFDFTMKCHMKQETSLFFYATFAIFLFFSFVFIRFFLLAVVVQTIV